MPMDMPFVEIEVARVELLEVYAIVTPITTPVGRSIKV